MTSLRTPFLALAILCMALTVLVELGSSQVLGGDGAGAGLAREAEANDVEIAGSTADVDEPPGRAISYLAFVDGIVLYTVLLMGLSLVISERAHGRAQGVATLIASIVLIIVAFIAAIIAFVELLVMVSLLLAVPFGTIAYLALWGFFPRGDAAVVLSLLLFLKLAFAVFLVLAQQRFLKQKGLVALVLTSLLLNVVVAFLHGFVPLVVVSIVDTLCALVIAVVAIIWAIVLLIGAIPSIVAAVRLGATDVAKTGNPNLSQ
jgi:hypothetical protein